jgi:hypothetical protein
MLLLNSAITPENYFRVTSSHFVHLFMLEYMVFVGKYEIERKNDEWFSVRHLRLENDYYTTIVQLLCKVLET